jgi:hypothetical protein
MSMRSAMHIARWFMVLLCLGLAPPAIGCELVLYSHRDAQELLRIAVPRHTPQFEIQFVHSVLGTSVVDRYALRSTAIHLIEERFEGDGYGLPHIAGPGERLVRDGAQQRLHLDRRVEPLVVRPLRAQQMRLHIGQRQWLLADLSLDLSAIEFRGHAC